MKKVAIIYNPVSGIKLFRNIKQQLEDVLNKYDFEYIWIETKKVPKQNFNKLLHDKFFRIIVAGGDGTVSQLASFCIKNGIRSPLIIIPSGSANLLAMSLKLPLFNIEKSIKNGFKNEGKFIDAMLVNDNHYGFVAGGTGYDALLIQQTSRKLKRLFGFFAYVVMFIYNFYFHRSKDYILFLDGKKKHVNAKSVLVCNIFPFTEFAFVRQFLKSRVHPSDGKIDVMVFNPKSFFDIFRLDQHIHSFEVKSVIISSARQKMFQIDGEIYNEKKLTIQSIPNAISVVY